MSLPPPFKLERYFARYEFAVRHLLGASDCEALGLDELLALADDECRRWWSGLTLGYTESAGHPLLRAEVARSYRTIDPQGVLMAIPAEAIFLALSTLVGAGEHAIVLTPCYQSLLEVARTVGCGVTPWPLRRERGAWRFDLDELAALVTADTRLLVVNFPHNPTGHLPSLREWHALIEFARTRSLYLFSDEMYRELELDPAARLPAACDEYERAISLSGLSKAFGAPGLRIGWLATRDRSLIDRWLQLKDYLTICGSAPSEVLAVIALRARDALLASNRAIVAGNLELAGKFFARDEFEWLPPRAGSTAFPVWKGATALDELCARALQRGLLMVPGSMFDFPGDHFRVGLGRRDFPRALEQLELCVDQA